MKIFFAMISFFLLASCGTQQKGTETPKIGEMVTTASGLQWMILKEGKGFPSKKGDVLVIYQTLSYKNGKILFSNSDTDTPIEVRLGAHQVTQGEEEGIIGMKEGEIRKLIIPPHLSKRKEYPPNLSPDSTLVLKVTLFKIKNKQT